MMRDWRSAWGQGDFPFLFVQIAPLDTGGVDRGEFRDAQREALAVPNTAYPQATLLNKAGLPASGFRTDDWPLTTRGAWKMFFEQINLDERTLLPKVK
jgi:hypothetical protein